MVFSIFISVSVDICHQSSVCPADCLYASLPVISWLNNVKPLLAVGVSQDTPSNLLITKGRGKSFYFINKYFIETRKKKNRIKSKLPFLSGGKGEYKDFKCHQM